MDDKIVKLNDYRESPGHFAVSITIETDGKITVDRDMQYLETEEEINWAISLIVMGLSDLIEMKKSIRGNS